MCGITGFLDLENALSKERFLTQLEKMTDALRHRGPDDRGEWFDFGSGIALGHTRLSILDLSPSGHQPKLSPSRRFCVSFNGEIYNFKELSAELEKLAVHPEGSSDTAVLLSAFDAWGVESTLKKLVGMFAFAVWDKKDRVLYIARDRMGEKPLFYGIIGGSFVFASELKTFFSCTNWSPDIDRDAVALYMRLAYIPAPYSVYRGIHKLPPGTFLAIPANKQVVADGLSPWPDDKDKISPNRYWSITSVVQEARSAPLFSLEESERGLETLLRHATRQQMVSDVPLGAFLSGGVDSSTVVALMQSESSIPVRTFTIGFDVPGFNEAEYASQVAKHLGTDHTELYLTADDAMSVIPSLPTVYDEPHADASQIPAILVSKLARQSVTVSLSGDGGDELFGGYNRYLYSDNIWRYIRRFPVSVRGKLASMLHSVDPAVWDKLFRRIPGRLPRMGYKIQKLADSIAAQSREDVYRNLISYWQTPSLLVKSSDEPPFSFYSLLNDVEVSFLDKMFAWDQLNYLPDDNLAKMDRASMSVGLETRAPLLDYRVVEHSWRLPMPLKIRKHTSKWILRRLLYKYVPKHLIERPKMGFSVPIGEWLRGPLRDWASDLLEERRLREQGILEPKMVSCLFRDHVAGRIEGQNQLWAVLMFEAWHRRYLND